MSWEMPFSPPAKDGPLVPGSFLSSGTTTYQVQSFLGQGAYGKVVQCFRTTDKKTVAIKMMQEIKSAEHEVAILQKLRELNSNNCNLVQWHQFFTDKEHFCIEFEHLDKSLLDLVQDRYCTPLCLKEIRPIVQQIATALQHLRSIGIIHADLKLENVMLVNSDVEPYRLKVIDFGLACHASTAKVGMKLQTLPYRSPEIMLGLPFTEAIDMWSLGCLAVCLYLSFHLYPGINEYDVMRYIVETQGMPPDNLLNCGKRTAFFFQRESVSTDSCWKLKTPKQFLQETRIESVEMRRELLLSLDDLLHINVVSDQNYGDKVAEMIDVLMFVDMIKGMLHLDAENRMTPHEVLKHAFISLHHIDSLYYLSSHVVSCFDNMNSCRGKTITSDSGTAECRSLQQTCTRHSDDPPVLQNPPLPPAEQSRSVRSHNMNLHPCTSTQTRSPFRSGRKRELEDEDRNMNRTSHQSKRHKAEEFDHQQHRKRLFTSRSSLPHPSSSETVNTASKSRPAHNLHQDISPIRTGLKERRFVDEDKSRRRIVSLERSDYNRIRVPPSVGLSTTHSGFKETNYVSPPIKRRMDNDGYYHNEKSHKRVRHTFGGSHYSAHSPHSKPDWIGTPTERHRYTEYESQASSGLKRQEADNEEVYHSRKRPTVFLQEGRRRGPYIRERRSNHWSGHGTRDHYRGYR